MSWLKRNPMPVANPGQPKFSADIPTSSFHYDKETKEFRAEASLLGWVPGTFPKTVMVKGEKKRVLYRRDDAKSTDVVIRYYPTEQSVSYTPACIGTSLVIFNT